MVFHQSDVHYLVRGIICLRGCEHLVISEQGISQLEFVLYFAGRHCLDRILWGEPGFAQKLPASAGRIAAGMTGLFDSIGELR
jgi:hypothetical protein